MRKSSLASLISVGLCLLILVACSPVTEATSATEPLDTEVTTPDMSPELVGNPIRGGQLYDKWWVPLGLDAPEEDHPIWASQSTNTRIGADTWRCKECHGWDYKGADGAYGSGSHFTGFVGILQLSGSDPNDILAVLQGETNPDHDFSSVMSEQALTDLALFVADQTVDFSSSVGEDKMALSTDLTAGNTLFEGACVECHGPEGLAINFSGDVSDAEYIAGIALGNPWEFMHKIRFGQPGTEMPSTIEDEWTAAEEAALLAYAQNLPNESLVSAGGLLYDKWWEALGADAPTGDHPLWSTQQSNTRTGQDTWRCKECHGWDYMGAEGAYGSGSHYTGFPGVSEATSFSLEEIFSWLDGTSNEDHDFSVYLDESSMAMLAAFLQEGTVDMSQYIDDEKIANGEVNRGQALYEVACSRCHGEDGKAINFGGEFLGDLALGNPWETLHKAANGQPGETMPSGLNLGWNWQDLVDLLSYLQTLPVAEE